MFADFWVVISFSYGRTYPLQTITAGVEFSPMNVPEVRRVEDCYVSLDAKYSQILYMQKNAYIIYE